MMALSFILNDVLKRSRAFWFAPFVLFVMAFSVRLLPLFVKNSYVIYFINMGILFLSVLTSILYLQYGVKKIVHDASELKYEAIFYKQFGLGLNGLFFLKLCMVVFYFLIFFVMISAVIWSLELKYLLLGLSICSFFVMMRVIALFFKMPHLYYLGILFIVISLFYPLYILPNVAFVFRSGSYKVILYLATYGLLYLLTALKLFYFVWREECIGWI
ncbi:MAG: hypothetical protein WCQ47_01700 [bacterium]